MQTIDSLERPEKGIIQGRFATGTSFHGALVVSGPDSLVYKVPAGDHHALCVRVYRAYIQEQQLALYAALLEQANVFFTQHFRRSLLDKQQKYWNLHIHTVPITTGTAGKTVYSVAPFIEGNALSSLPYESFFSRKSLDAIMDEVNASIERELGHTPLGMTDVNTKYRVNHQDSNLVLIATDISPRISSLRPL